MKIFITRFIWDGIGYEGPDIHAQNEDDAQLIAESQGLELEGELTDLISISDLTRHRVLH